MSIWILRPSRINSDIIHTLYSRNMYMCSNGICEYHNLKFVSSLTLQYVMVVPENFFSPYKEAKQWGSLLFGIFSPSRFPSIPLDTLKGFISKLDAHQHSLQGSTPLTVSEITVWKTVFIFNPPYPQMRMCCLAQNSRCWFHFLGSDRLDSFLTFSNENLAVYCK